MAYQTSDGQWTGILNNFDLSLAQDRLGDTPSGQERTGLNCTPVAVGSAAISEHNGAVGIEYVHFCLENNVYTQMTMDVDANDGNLVEMDDGGDKQMKMDVDANNGDLVEMDDGGGKQMGDKSVGNANDDPMDVDDTGGVANDGDHMDVDDAGGEYTVAGNLNDGILMDVDDTGGDVTVDARNANDGDIMDVDGEYTVYMDVD
ncbi:hypothetical protein EDB19DRAFT_1920595 [Suillus lakei]|nr:hypothetical protein EDB19DRAFT_1920595 [Suillus lakei]